jgi:hypothetical protein
MTDVLAAGPIGAPVYRMDAELLCRDLDGDVHRAVERLREAGAAGDEVAALLGLRTEQLAVVDAQLDGTGGRRVRTLRVWVDPAHGMVLSHDGGLDLIARHKRPQIPLLDIPPPLADELPRERFSRAASTRGAERERIVVDEVLALRADLHASGRARHGDGRDHLLMLPDTSLVVRAGADRPTVEVHHGGLPDEALTAIAQELVVDAGELRFERLTADAATAAGERLHAALGTGPDDVLEVSLDPAAVQERLYAEVALADAQLVLVCDAQKRNLPAWLNETLRDASRRGVECVVRCAPERGHTRPAPPGTGIVVVRDRARVLAHSDAAPLGAKWNLPDLASQACVSVHEPRAVARVLELLDVAPPALRAERNPLEPLVDIAVHGMREALKRLRDQLPPELPVVLTEEDEEAFCEQVERNPINLHDEVRVDAVARGMVWERMLAVACHALEDRHPQLVVEDFRRQVPGKALDLDVIMRDDRHRVWWILDAKCKPRPSDEDYGMMRRQLAAVHELRWVKDGYEARGATVYPNYAKDVAEVTPDERILRWRLNALERRLTEPPPLGG